MLDCVSITNRFGVPSKVLGICLIHLTIVIHARQEDCDLDNLGKTAACGLEDSTKVANCLRLERVSDTNRLNSSDKITYSSILDGALDELSSLGV